MSKPFEGIRVLDFTQVMAGPYATYQLALLGADVIKVERREGEDLRYMDLRRNEATRPWAEQGRMPAWQSVNGGKRSLTLDLRKAGAVDVVKQLARSADVVVENFRPGVMDRLGIGYATLSELNPKLIYCAVSAFGQTGPEREAGGYDGKIQALSGIMAMTGHETTGPTRVGFALCDIIAGLTAAFGISSALIQRGRTGRGQLVDVSMLEAALSFVSAPLADFSLTGQETELLGNRPFTRSPTSDLYPTAEGDLLLAVVSEKQFAALMTALGRPDLLEDPRFGTDYLRKQNEITLREAITGELAKKSALAWEVIIDQAGAPCACLRKLEQVIDHPQVVARQALQQLASPFGVLRFAGAGFRLAHGNAELRSMAPMLGEHNSEILQELGRSQEDIAALAEAKII